MATPSSNNVRVGRGSILLDRYTDEGVSSGKFVHLGNCDSLAIAPAVEKLELTDYTQETSANYDERVIKTDVNLTISGFEFDPFAFALAVMGEQTTLTQAGGAVTAEALVSTAVTNVAGSFFKLSNRNVSGVVLTQGTATLTSGTAWELYNALGGMIWIKPSGGVTDGTAITAAYTAAALTGTAALDVVRGAVKSAINGKLIHIPRNSSGPKWELEVYKASFAPSGEIGLISDEYGKWTLTGKALSDAEGSYGGSSDDPYFRLIKQA